MSSGCRHTNIGIASKLSSSVAVSPLVPRPLTKRNAPAGVRVGRPCICPSYQSRELSARVWRYDRLATCSHATPQRRIAGHSGEKSRTVV